MKIKIAVFFIVLTKIVFAQTENHKAIAGTKYSLVPPAGFIAVTNFSGFQNKDAGASIMITEMPAPIETISEGFTASALKSRGMNLLSKETITFHQANATYITLSQSAGGTTYLKQILVFGDEKKSVLVNGIYPEANKAIEEEIKKSLLSTSYNAAQSDNPLDAVEFSIDVTGTGFTLAKFIAGSLLYSTDGQIPTEKPTLIVGPSIANVSPANRQQYSVDRLKKLPGRAAAEVKEINSIEIDHLQGFEILATGKNKTGKNDMVYLVMLFTEERGYYILVGESADDAVSSTATFRKIAKTFKRK